MTVRVLSAAGAALGFVAVTALAGCTAADLEGSQSRSATPTPTPTPIPSPTPTVLAPGEPQPLSPGTYVLDVFPPGPDELPDAVVEVSSDGFRGDGVFVSAYDGSVFRNIGIVTIADVARDPCYRTSGPFEDPGPAVADLAAALAAQARTDATDPVAVALAGYDGLYLESSVPDDIVESDCDDEAYASWRVGDGVRVSRGPPGMVDRLWILDVDGHRLVVNASHGPGASTGQIDELTRIVESITFTDAAT